MVKKTLQEIMNQVKKTQEELAKTHEGLENLQVEGNSGGGMVKAIVNGRQELLDIKIEKELVNPDEVDSKNFLR